MANITYPNPEDYQNVCWVGHSYSELVQDMRRARRRGLRVPLRENTDLVAECAEFDRELDREEHRELRREDLKASRIWMETTGEKPRLIYWYHLDRDVVSKIYKRSGKVLESWCVRTKSKLEEEDLPERVMFNLRGSLWLRDIPTTTH